MFQNLFDLPMLAPLAIALIFVVLQPLRVDKGTWAYQKVMFVVLAAWILLTALILLF